MRFKGRVLAQRPKAKLHRREDEGDNRLIYEVRDGDDLLELGEPAFSTNAAWRAAYYCLVRRRHEEKAAS